MLFWVAYVWNLIFPKKYGKVVLESSFFGKRTFHLNNLSKKAKIVRLLRCVKLKRHRIAVQPI